MHPCRAGLLPAADRGVQLQHLQDQHQHQQARYEPPIDVSLHWQPTSTPVLCQNTTNPHHLSCSPRLGHHLWRHYDAAQLRAHVPQHARLRPVRAHRCALGASDAVSLNSMCCSEHRLLHVPCLGLDLLRHVAVVQPPQVPLTANCAGTTFTAWYMAGISIEDGVHNSVRMRCIWIVCQPHCALLLSVCRCFRGHSWPIAPSSFLTQQIEFSEGRDSSTIQGKNHHMLTSLCAGKLHSMSPDQRPATGRMQAASKCHQCHAAGCAVSSKASPTSCSHSAATSCCLRYWAAHSGLKVDAFFVFRQVVDCVHGHPLLYTYHFDDLSCRSCWTACTSPPSSTKFSPAPTATSSRSPSPSRCASIHPFKSWCTGLRTDARFFKTSHLLQLRRPPIFRSAAMRCHSEVYSQ